MAQSGKTGIGNKKHGISGKTSKSPRLRFQMKLDAEKDERKTKSICEHGSIQDLMKSR